MAVVEAKVEEVVVEEASSRASVISATSGVTRPANARHQAMELAQLATASVQRKVQLYSNSPRRKRHGHGWFWQKAY